MSSLDITVTDAGGAVRNSVTVPSGAAAVKIIAALVDQLKLPLTSPDEHQCLINSTITNLVVKLAMPPHLQMLVFKTVILFALFRKSSRVNK